MDTKPRRQCRNIFRRHFFLPLAFFFLSGPKFLNADCLARQEATPVYGYKIVNSFPHDSKAFTQGLIFNDDVLYESTGKYGRSSLRKVDLISGSVLQSTTINPEYFAEGLALVNGNLIQLTWRDKIGLVYDKQLTFLYNFVYPDGIIQGWGLTHDGVTLYLSDGTSTLHLLDPTNFKKIGQIFVSDQEIAVRNLNELEFIEGEIFANVWLSECIVRIDPNTGKVLSWIDLSGLGRTATSSREAVLNGIAYDAIGKRLFVTGKMWPKLFEIELVSP